MNYKDTVYRHYLSKFKGEGSDASFRNSSRKVGTILAPWVARLDRSSPAIDLGCGAGELLEALAQFGFTSLAGCDISPEQIQKAVLRFPNVVEADLFAYLNTQQNASIELITVFDVIEHLSRQETFALLKLVEQKLRAGGRFIAHVPNGLSPFVGHVFWGDITHEWCLTPQTASTLCSINGFRSFDVVENLGAGMTLKGVARKMTWSLLRKGLQFINTIETGHSGGEIWTRNFAFMAEKPRSTGRNTGTIEL